MKVYIIDNYDSFTYNLYQLIGEILTSEKNQGHITDFDIIVKRNNLITLDEIQREKPDKIIISPGPGTPDDEKYFGICTQVIKILGPTTPLLGVCLGMQGIVHVFGGNIVKAPLPVHGKTSSISHDKQNIFKNIPDELEVMRYHSLIAEAVSLPKCLKVTSAFGNISVEEFQDAAKLSENRDFEVMAIEHKDFPIYGIQFHPESLATEGGKELIKNFLFLD